MIDIEELKIQILKVINSLDLKCHECDEDIVCKYLYIYKEVSKSINAKESIDLNELRFLLKKLKGLTRGYMETSSDYMQDFLNDMSKVEKLIDQI